MAIGYRFDADVLVVEVLGDHEIEDFFTCVAAAQADDRWQGSALLLIDVRQSPAVTRRTPQELRKVVEYLSARPGTFRRRAAMVVSTSMQQEISRVGETIAEFFGNEVRTFYDPVEAAEWLRVRAPEPAAPDAPAEKRPLAP